MKCKISTLGGYICVLLVLLGKLLVTRIPRTQHHHLEGPCWMQSWMFSDTHRVQCLQEQFIGFLSYLLDLQLRQILLLLALFAWNCWNFCPQSLMLEDYENISLYDQGKVGVS